MLCTTSGGSRSGVWWGQSSKAPKSLHLLKYRSFSATFVGYHTKAVTFSRPRKWPVLLVELCDLSGNHHSLKSHFIINSQNVWSGPKGRSYFSQATHNWERYGCPKNSFVSTISVWKIYTTAVFPNPSLTANRSMLDDFTSAREYSSNRVSMGKIDQSHAQKASLITTSIHFVISRPGA